MSGVRVRTAIEQMEAWLADPTWEPDPENLRLWHADFKAALAEAKQAPGWPDLADRAHAAGKLLEARIPVVEKVRDRLKAELEVQERGNRALKGYGAGTR